MTVKNLASSSGLMRCTSLLIEMLNGCSRASEHHEWASISGVESVLEPLLSLNTTIRSISPRPCTSGWTRCSRPQETIIQAQKMYNDVKSAGFRVYMTDSLPEPRKCTLGINENHPEARYGLIKSSRDKSLDLYGVAGLPGKTGESWKMVQQFAETMAVRVVLRFGFHRV